MRQQNLLHYKHATVAALFCGVSETVVDMFVLLYVYAKVGTSNWNFNILQLFQQITKCLTSRNFRVAFFHTPVLYQPWINFTDPRWQRLNQKKILMLRSFRFLKSRGCRKSKEANCTKCYKKNILLHCCTVACR